MLAQADQMLHDFVFLIGPLYGVKKCTMNAHLLQHLAYYVRKCGLLWCYSCFAFEGFNKFIKALVHGTHHAAEQIACALGLTLGLRKFVRNVLESPIVNKSVKKVLRKFSGVKIEDRGVKTNVSCGYFLGRQKKIATLSEDIQTFSKIILLNRGLCSEDSSLSFFGRFVNTEGNLFYSRLHAQTKKINSTVIEYFQPDGQINFGVICAFIKVDETNAQFFYIIHKLIEVHQTVLYQGHNLDVDMYSPEVKRVLMTYERKNVVTHHKMFQHELGNMDIIELEQIHRKCISLDFLEEFWVISSFPNNIEPH